jgi:hypothetical protein
VRNFVLATADNFRHHRGLFRAIVERGLDHPHAMKTIFGFREELAAALEKCCMAGASLPVRVMTQMVYGFLITGVLNPTRRRKSATRVPSTNSPMPASPIWSAQMTLSIDLFWSFRSPYSYLATPRLVEMEREYDLNDQRPPRLSAGCAFR